jgi:ribosomal protein S18 acetylase RimI-like enzyme
VEHGPKDALTYWKIPFEWRPGQAPMTDDEPDGMSWAAMEDDERTVTIVAAVLAASPDASDVAAVAALGPRDAARQLLEAPPAWAMSHRREWWARLSLHGEAAGFVLPVTYDDTAQDGRDEGTIFHLGVAPEQRGQGLGRLLLRRATRTLAGHGVWRIYCDTAADNAPMIRLFASEGWTRLAPHEQPVGYESPIGPG